QSEADCRAISSPRVIANWRSATRTGTIIPSWTRSRLPSQIPRCALCPIAQFFLPLGTCGMEADTSEAPRLLRFSTDMLPERDRFPAFREEFVRRVLRMD